MDLRDLEIKALSQYRLRIEMGEDGMREIRLNAVGGFDWDDYGESHWFVDLLLDTKILWRIVVIRNGWVEASLNVSYVKTGGTIEEARGLVRKAFWAFEANRRHLQAAVAH